MPRTHAKDILNNKRFKFLPILACLLCLALTLWAALWSWSELVTVRPANLLTQWQQNPAKFDQTLATSLLPRLKQSLAVNTGDANSYLLLAEVYQLIAEYGEMASDEFNKQNTPPQKMQKQSYLDLAELNYKKAIQHQPTWHYAWAKLALFYSDTIIKPSHVVGPLRECNPKNCDTTDF
jgi:hypothetical protein